MKSPRRFKLGEKGFTLIEVMIVTALIGIIIPAMTLLFLKMNQGMAADEMHTQLQVLNEQTQLRLHERLVAGRHLCQGNASGNAYLTKVTAGRSAATNATYPVLGGSLLAQLQPTTGNGSFSPVTATQANFGNSLLIGIYDAPQTFGNLSNVYAAPASVFGASITYGPGFGGGAATIVIDLYRFYYYYLTTANPKALKNVASYRLIEWQSIQYADYNEIQDISDLTLKQAVITWLATPGNPSPGNAAIAVTCAWDPTGTDPTTAFYQLKTNGTAPPINPASITEAFVTPLTHVSSGILSGGFNYGISSNSSGWKDAPATVPQFGVANASFPGGFEVGISGTSTGREVLTRCLLVAQGGTPKIVWNDQTMVHNVRDVW
jgi:prepilin-type N-terminal cleavage/methylation domain-containing protein